MGIDIFGVDILGIDILGIDILAPTLLHILGQNKWPNSVSLTPNAFVNTQSECGFHLKTNLGTIFLW